MRRQPGDGMKSVRFRVAEEIHGNSPTPREKEVDVGMDGESQLSMD